MDIYICFIRRLFQRNNFGCEPFSIAFARDQVDLSRRSTSKNFKLFISSLKSHFTHFFSQQRLDRKESWLLLNSEFALPEVFRQIVNLDQLAFFNHIKGEVRVIETNYFWLIFYGRFVRGTMSIAYWDFFACICGLELMECYSPNC